MPLIYSQLVWLMWRWRGGMPAAGSLLATRLRGCQCGPAKAPGVNSPVVDYPENRTAPLPVKVLGATEPPATPRSRTVKGRSGGVKSPGGSPSPIVKLHLAVTAPCGGVKKPRAANSRRRRRTRPGTCQGTCPSRCRAGSAAPCPRADDWRRAHRPHHHREHPTWPDLPRRPRARGGAAGLAESRRHFQRAPPWPRPAPPCARMNRPAPPDCPTPLARLAPG